MHRFVLDGMAEHACWLENTSVYYYAYVEPKPKAGKGLLAALAAHACVVVTDDFPCSFLPRMVASAARQVSVLMEVVDSNGLLPMRQAEKAYPTAYAFRRFLQSELPRHLMDIPKPNALSKAQLPPARSIPAAITERWPEASPQLLSAGESVLAGIPLDHEVPPIEIRGGSTAAQTRLRNFLRSKLPTYAEARNEPAHQATSELSPYLHFGHISVHQIFSELTKQEGWSPGHLAVRATGSRSGWWGASQNAEAFLDQVITWRELGFNCCQMRTDYDQFESLPAWALKTLRLHARDERSHVYSLEKFERAQTHDPLWNAAQTQLLQEGRIAQLPAHAVGKENHRVDSHSPKGTRNHGGVEQQVCTRWAGSKFLRRDLLVSRAYDRPWAPERPIFGTVRYMSTENTARKFNVREYVHQYGSSYKGVTLEK